MGFAGTNTPCDCRSFCNTGSTNSHRMFCNANANTPHTNRAAHQNGQATTAALLPTTAAPTSPLSNPAQTTSILIPMRMSTSARLPHCLSHSCLLHYVRSIRQRKADSESVSLAIPIAVRLMNNKRNLCAVRQSTTYLLIAQYCF